MRTLLADISSGHHALADWLFLLAFVLAVIATYAAYVVKQVRWSPPALAAAVAALALGFLVT